MPYLLILAGISCNTFHSRMRSFTTALEELISQKTEIPFQLASTSGLSGGCIHTASAILGSDGRQFFVKQNAKSALPAFEAEQIGLTAIEVTAQIRVPQPVGTCHADGQAALVLEHLEMGHRKGDFPAMGTQLARMHRCCSPTFGWPSDNWIGSTPQINTQTPDWIGFFSESRLHPQIALARNKGLKLGQAEQLIERLPEFFEGYVPVPSLLHGDLWAGNASFLEDASPVIYDPAAYYGDRETDIAMTEMFGGFPREFYAAYDTEWPRDAGYPLRKPLYNLYHVLNHYNLFGGGYGYQAESTISLLLNSLPGN